MRKLSQHEASMTNFLWRLNNTHLPLHSHEAVKTRAPPKWTAAILRDISVSRSSEDENIQVLSEKFNKFLQESQWQQENQHHKEPITLLLFQFSFLSWQQPQVGQPHNTMLIQFSWFSKSTTSYQFIKTIIIHLHFYRWRNQSQCILSNLHAAKE